MSDVVPVFTTPSPMIRRIPLDRPWRWLAAGWRDMTQAPAVSLTYGAVLVAISLALTLGLWLTGWIYVVLPLAAGFMLISPILAVGLYETSRRLAAGEPVGVALALGAWRRNGEQLAYLGLVLMLIHLAWVRIATLLVALFFTDRVPGWDDFIEFLLFSSISLPFLVVSTLIGAVLAVLVFAVGAISIPMLLDRRVSVFTAVATSVVAVRQNWHGMLLWAVLIVAATLFGLATLFIGLAVTWPLIGHATWHAYRDLVEDSGPADQRRA